MLLVRAFCERECLFETVLHPMLQFPLCFGGIYFVALLSLSLSLSLSLNKFWLNCNSIDVPLKHCFVNVQETGVSVGTMMIKSIAYGLKFQHQLDSIGNHYSLILSHRL